MDGNKNGIGDACEDDDDGDGVDNDKVCSIISYQIYSLLW